MPSPIIFDMQGGIAGDMVVAAALDLGVDQALFKSELRKLGLEFEVLIGKADRGGIHASTFSVQYPHQHHHRGLTDILAIIAKSGLADPVKETASRIFTRLAEAEARVHGSAVDKVHFHEVGAVDAIVDITGAALAFHLLGASEFYLTPFPFGHGTVKTAHGVLSLPAPATVELTKGFAVRRLDVEGELVTPTGAAIATALAAGPASALGGHACRAAGYGAGTKDFPGLPNVLRLLLCERGGTGEERVAEIQTNMDDAPGEIVGRALEALMAAGALDVYTSPVGMKKGRPGVLLTVLCRPADRDRLSKMLLKETGSIGLRYCEKERLCLKRTAGEVETRFGKVRTKIIDMFGESLVTPEYESCREAAQKAGVTVREIYAAVTAAKH